MLLLAPIDTQLLQISHHKGVLALIQTMPSGDCWGYMAKFGCSMFLVFRWGERPNERVITVGIGWVLLASATSRFSGYIKLAYCSSAKGAPVA